MQQSGELGKRLQEMEGEAYELAGQPFNLGSPKQLGEILFEKLQAAGAQENAHRRASTAEEVLVELALDYPLPKLLLEYRSLSKLKSTYTDKLPEMINPVTGRVHTSYHQAVAATGRLSSTDPNLQNIPIRTAGGQAYPPGLYRTRGLQDPGGGLLADRAAHHGPPVRRRGAASRRSTKAGTCIPPLPPKSSRCRWTRCPPSSGARPRRSISD